MTPTPTAQMTMPMCMPVTTESAELMMPPSTATPSTPPSWRLALNTPLPVPVRPGGG